MTTNSDGPKTITIITDSRRSRHDPFRMICTECQRAQAVAILTEQVVPDPVLVWLSPNTYLIPRIGFDAFQTVHHGKCPVCETTFVSAGVIWCEEQPDHVRHRRDRDGTTAKLIENIKGPRSSREES